MQRSRLKSSLRIDVPEIRGTIGSSVVVKKPVYAPVLLPQIESIRRISIANQYNETLRWRVYVHLMCNFLSRAVRLIT